MKLTSTVTIPSALLLIAVDSSLAFTQPRLATTVSTAARMSEEITTSPDEVESTVEAPPTPVAPSAPVMSASLPWMERPAVLDGSMVGDVGFDPVGFAQSKDDLLKYREAEVKHGRLAMLAAAGWPLSELFDKKLANTLGLTPVVDASDRAPSILNGGLGKINPAYWIACLALGAAVDLYGIRRAQSNDPTYFPGNLGFDPLNMYPQDAAGQRDMQLKELKNGRLAMIAITAFAFQEFVQKIGVIDETPIFFKPFSTVVREYANSGYIYPDN